MIQHSYSWTYIQRKPKFEKNMDPNVHCSTIHNSQDLEATQMPNNRWMDKDVVQIQQNIIRP